MKQSTKKEKLNTIKVFNGDKSILVEKHSTTFYTVRRALNGEIHTDLSIQIRESAIGDLGGLEIKPEEQRASENNIKVFDGDKMALKEIFFTSYSTIQKALNGTSKTLLSYQIRASAIKEFGGKEIRQQ